MLDQGKPTARDARSVRELEARAQVAEDRVHTAIALIVVLVAIIALLLFTGATRAEDMQEGVLDPPPAGGIVQPRGYSGGTCHQEGWFFNTQCCCVAGWCRPIPCSAVRHDGKRYVLTLRPGDHPMVSKPTRWVVDERSVDLSPDEKCYACAGGTTLRCLLVGSAGS